MTSPASCPLGARPDFIPYTRLEGTKIMELSRAQYALNRMRYHNFEGHIVTNYRHMARLRMEYDLELDVSNLVHDVIMGPDAEIRSMAFVRQHGSDIPGIDMNKVCDLIATTMKHTPLATDPRLAMIDLMSFASDDEIRNADSDLLRLEAMDRAGDDFDQTAWAEGTIGYASALYHRVSADLPISRVGPLERQIWREIAEGAEQAIGYVTGKYLLAEDGPRPA